MNKVQLGVSYIPNFYDYGSSVVKTDIPSEQAIGLTNVWNGSASPYQDVIKGDISSTPVTSIR